MLFYDIGYSIWCSWTKNYIIKILHPQMRKNIEPLKICHCLMHKRMIEMRKHESFGTWHVPCTIWKKNEDNEQAGTPLFSYSWFTCSFPAGCSWKNKLLTFNKQKKKKKICWFFGSGSWWMWKQTSKIHPKNYLAWHHRPTVHLLHLDLFQLTREVHLTVVDSAWKGIMDDYYS